MPFDVMPTGKPTATVRVLLRARERVEREWVNHKPRARGQHCLMTAMGFVLWPSVFRATNIICEIIGTPCIPMWNDIPGRTKDEVLAVIDAALVRAQFGP